MSHPRKRLGLLFGGQSSEHSISIRSAHSVLENLDRERFEPILVGIHRSGVWRRLDETAFVALGAEVGENGTAVVPARGRTGLSLLDGDEQGGARPPGAPSEDAEIEVVFPVLHGPCGEDGTIQGMLEMLDVPYVGAGVLGSAVGMDKDVQKRLLRDAGIPVVPFIAFTEREWKDDRSDVRERCRALGTSLYVKPANQGSSIGVSRVAAGGDLPAAVAEALRYDRKVLVEAGVDAREIECSVLGNESPRASLPGEILPGEDLYTFDAKYAAGSQAQLLIPAPLPEETTSRIRDVAVRAFLATECNGMARVDFLLDRKSGALYVNELNTIPGFTSISMYPKLWEATGLPYGELLTRLIDLAEERHQQRGRLRSGIHSS